MPLLLPILVFAAAFLIFWGVDADRAGDLSGWGGAFIRAAAVWGALVVLFSEGLSLFTALRAGPLAVLWGLALLILLAVLARRRTLPRLWGLRSTLAAIRFSIVEGLILLGLAAEAVSLLAIAWNSPPNNTDSLTYHMARVAHWAQMGAIAHYPAGYEPQVMHPIWSETAILNLRLLWGNDQPANLIQLFSTLGSWVAVGALARLLGAGRRAQLLAVAFAASLPIGILEATSTQNDAAAGLWLVCLGFFVLEEHRRGLSRLELVLAGLTLGLGFLTKGTFYPYAAVLGAWLVVSRLGRGGWRTALRDGLVVGALAVLLNAGFWARNYQTYRAPLGSPEWVGAHVSRAYSPGGILASWAENLALNLGTPSEEINERIIGAIRSLRPQEGESQFGLVWAWNNENLAGNPLHLSIVALTAVAVFAAWARRRDAGARLAGAYAAALLASTLLLFSILDFDLYGVRYQIPFFVAWAPILGVAAERAGRPRAALGASLILLLLGTPWVLLNASRPAIGMKPRTMIDSVFDEVPEVILMANWTPLRDGYFGAAEAVRASGCTNVGLRLDSHDLEYAYWWLLDAPQSGIRLENIDPPPHLERYVDPGFRPCAIICMVCGGRTRFHGLEKIYSSGEISVFVGDGFIPTED